MSGRQAMGSADAAWLHMDRPTNLMVVNCVLWFDQPVDWDRFRAVVSDRLVAPFPRFRQRVVEARLGVGMPHWEDDAGFDLDLHFHRVSLPAPGDREALQAFVADRMVVPLDRARPLWEFHLVDGYGDGCAVLARMHHCIADGIALARVLLSLSDERPDAGLAPPDRQGPAVGGGRAGSLLRPAAFALSLTRGVLEGALDVLVHPQRTIDLVTGARDNAQTLAKVLLTGPDADTVLRGELGVPELVAWSEPFPLEDVKTLAHAHGATVNDVLVAAMTGALRDYLVARDSIVEEIRAVVPFNLRPLAEPLPRDLGNRFGLVKLPLPVGIAEPAARLEAVKREMGAIKRSPEGPIAYGILSAIGITPVQVESALIDLFSSQGTVVVTNVPGPASTVYLAGSPVRGALVWAPVSGSMAMSVGILSYAGQVTVGVMSDAGLVPDPETIVGGFLAELGRLQELPA